MGKKNKKESSINPKLHQKAPQGNILDPTSHYNV